MGNRKICNAWTLDEEHTLRRLWPHNDINGIAAKMGRGRNSIIGKSYRLNLERKRDTPEPTVRQLPPLPAEKPVRSVRRFHAKPIVVARSDDPPPARACQWPHGEPGTRAFHFCGSETKPGKPYCEAHCAVAYRKYLPLDEYRKGQTS